MGVRGLYDYINDRREKFSEPYKLHDTWLIIDGLNVSHQILTEMRVKNNALGGNYDSYGWQVEQFYRTLKLCNITPIVVLDGIPENLCGYLQKLTEEEKEQLNLRRNQVERHPLLLPEVFRDITRKMGVQLVRSIYQADDSIAALAKALDCPVLSCDTDFYLYGVKYIHYRSLSHESTEWAGGHALSCKIYNVDKLLNKFPGLHESLLPLALELLRNNYTHSETWKFFYRSVATTQKYVIPGTLSWLSIFSSLNEAVGALMRYTEIDIRQEIVARLEKSISHFSIASESILAFVNLNEDVINNLREKKKIQRFVFQRRIGMPPLTQCAEVNRVTLSALKNEGGQEGGSHVSEEELIAAAPDWWYQDFATGILRGTVMKLFVHYFQISKLKSDYCVFPPIREVDVPLITRLFEFITSSTEEEELLFRVHIKNDDKEVRDIIIKKLSIDLKTVRNYGRNERQRIINKILRIKNEKNLEKLPEKWRLYVATVMYWKRHKYEYESTNTHLFALLFTMLFDIVDERIGFKRPAESHLCKKVRGLSNFPDNEKSKLSTNEVNNGHSKSMNVVDSVTREDCVAAATFFRSHSIMPDAEFERLPDTWVDFIDVFRQFQRSLVYIIQLNALLGYPYTSPPVHELYSATLLYNVFDELSKADNMDLYMEKTLEKSPGLVSVLKLLKKVVMNELEVPKPRTFHYLYIIVGAISIGIIYLIALGLL